MTDLTIRTEPMIHEPDAALVEENRPTRRDWCEWAWAFRLHEISWGQERWRDFLTDRDELGWRPAIRLLAEQTAKGLTPG